jgi:hypothetical protein
MFQIVRKWTMKFNLKEFILYYEPYKKHFLDLFFH